MPRPTNKDHQKGGSKIKQFSPFVMFHISQQPNCTILCSLSYYSEIQIRILEHYMIHICSVITRYSAQWGALCAKITEVNLYAFVTDCFMIIYLHSSEPDKLASVIFV